MTAAGWFSPMSQQSANRFLVWQVFPYSIALSFTSAALVGILFGLLPAQKAAQLDAIIALHHE